MQPKNTTIAENSILSPEDLMLVMDKSRSNKFIFALMLLFHRTQGRFPISPFEFHPKTIDMVAQQLNVVIPKGDFLDKAVRTSMRYRTEIRQITSFRESTNADADMLTQWLQESATIVNYNPNQLILKLEERCQQLLIEPPSLARLDSIMRTVVFTRDEDLYSKPTFDPPLLKFLKLNC